MQNDIVLLTVDSLRNDYVFNTKGDVRRGLDTLNKLVESGTSFGEAWSTGANTVDSFPAIMSGEYQWSFSPQRKGFEADRPHLAEVLKKQGYNTGGFHSNVYLKERFGYNRGFDHYTSSGSDEEGIPSPLKIIEKIATSNKYAERFAYNTMNLLGQQFGIDLRGKPYTSANQLNSRAREWVTTQSGPIFLWIHYMDVHSPWYSREGTASEELTDDELAKAFYTARDLSKELDEATYEVLRRGYKGSIQHLDKELGGFLEFLNRELNDPLIVFTSDHGELFGEEGLVLHPLECLHENILRVPFIIKGAKDRIQPKSPVSTVDIYPTIVDFASGRVPESAGQSLLRQTDDERVVFAETGSRDDGSLRIIGQDDSYVVDISEEGAYSSEVNMHLQRIDESRIDSVEEYDESDIEDRLEALGYKAE